MDNLFYHSDNYYEILNVGSTASQDEIKKAYKKLASIYHPDVANDDSTEIFKNIVRAYTVLRDNELRDEYDKQLAENNKVKKLSFKFYFEEIIKRVNIFNTFKIFFKEINEKNRLDIEDKDFLKPDVAVSEKILEMSLNELEERLEYSQNIFVKMNAAIAIGYKKEKQSYTLLKKMVVDSDIDVKKAVIWAIGNLGLKNSLNFLKIIYDSNNSIIRLDILKAIFRIAGGKGKFLNNMLMRGLNDNNEEVRLGALELFVYTNKKILFEDIKELYKSISIDKKILIDKLVNEKRIVNFEGDNNV